MTKENFTTLWYDKFTSLLNMRFIHKDIKKNISKKKIFLFISKFPFIIINFKKNKLPIIRINKLIVKFPINIAIG